MTIADNELLQQQNDVIEVYDFSIPGAGSFSLTSYYKTTSIGGNSYTATPIQRNGIDFASDMGDITTTIIIPESSVIGYVLQGGTPQGFCTVTVSRYLLSDLSGTPDVPFEGYVKKVEISAGVVTLSLSSWLDDMGRDFPRLRAQTMCNNTLYDGWTVDGTAVGCGLPLSAWQWGMTVTAVDAAAGTVTATGGTPPSGKSAITVSGYFNQGMLSFASYSIRIADHSVTGTTHTFTLQSITAEQATLLPLATVKASPGCNKTFNFGTAQGLSCPNNCTLPFSNTARFLGMERIPYKNASITPVNGL